MSLAYRLQKLLRETTLAGHVLYNDVAAADTTSIVAANNLANKAQTIAAQPDVPRNLVITVVDSTPGITAGLVTIVGVNACGQTVTEVHNCAAGAGTYTGSVAFATITSITTSNFTALDEGGDETIAVGVGLKLGLPVDILASVYKTCVAGANEAVGTVSLPYGTIITTTAPDNSRDFDIWYTYYLGHPMA